MSNYISRTDAIDEITEYGSGDTIYMSVVELKRRIEQLPSAQPENADCIYCHEDSDGYVKPIEKNCHAFIRFGMNGWCLELRAKGWHGEAKINYCPMCGRRLRNG